VRVVYECQHVCDHLITQPEDRPTMDDGALRLERICDAMPDAAVRVQRVRGGRLCCVASPTQQGASMMYGGPMTTSNMSAAGGGTELVKRPNGGCECCVRARVSRADGAFAGARADDDPSVASGSPSAGPLSHYRCA
jgi:hypothetical protein